MHENGEHMKARLWCVSNDMKCIWGRMQTSCHAKEWRRMQCKLRMQQKALTQECNTMYKNASKLSNASIMTHWQNATWTECNHMHQDAINSNAPITNELKWYTMRFKWSLPKWRCSICIWMKVNEQKCTYSRMNVQGRRMRYLIMHMNAQKCT